jgi:cytochrome c oxidase assembly protein subunit 15
VLHLQVWKARILEPEEAVVRTIEEPRARQPELHIQSRTDWRLQIPEERRRHLRIWLASGAVLTFLILVIGGITRLTQSGLSIVDWNPIMGVVPPLSEAQWLEAFDRYRQFPEYQKLRQGMTLSEFQFIFFWEYVHRLAARLIGLVFLIPFVFFWIRGYFTPQLRNRVLALFGLGALQGFMGWFMVMSGLVDNPSVSHYRLAAHLSIALVIFGLCLWLFWELRVSRLPTPRRTPGRGIYALGGLLMLQILWGAFVAGLDAGLYFNTFPLMGGRLVPPGAMSLEPALRNLVENPVTVQWVHRVLGTVLALASLAVVVQHWRLPADLASRRLSTAFATLVLVQYGLGILTVIYFVPVSLGVLHQATAVVILAIWLAWLHHTRNSPGWGPLAKLS